MPIYSLSSCNRTNRTSPTFLSRLRHFLLLIGLILSGCGGKAESPLVFLVLGDIHYNSVTEPARPFPWMISERFIEPLAWQLEAWEQKPEFIIQTGDFVHGGGGRAAVEFNYGFKEFEQSLGLPLIISRGNHDDLPDFREVALPRIGKSLARELDRTYFSFKSNHSRFIILDSEFNDLDTMAGWLDDQLTESKGDDSTSHVFVFGHHPLWVVARRGFTRTEFARAALPILARHEVDAYFCGHTHNVSVTRRQFTEGSILQVMTVSTWEEGRLAVLVPPEKWPDPSREPEALPLDEVRPLLVPADSTDYFFGYIEGVTEGYTRISAYRDSVRLEWGFPGRPARHVITWNKAGETLTFQPE